MQWACSLMVGRLPLRRPLPLLICPSPKDKGSIKGILFDGKEKEGDLESYVLFFQPLDASPLPAPTVPLIILTNTHSFNYFNKQFCIHRSIYCCSDIVARLQLGSASNVSSLIFCSNGSRSFCSCVDVLHTRSSLQTFVYILRCWTGHTWLSSHHVCCQQK